MLIGLTGMSCAGKNYIASLLARRGFAVADVDKLGHTATENKKEAIFSRFGDDVKNPDGTVNRRLLGKKVIGKEAEMSALEDIIHPEANRLLLEWVSAQNASQNAQNGKACVINAALLHKCAVFADLDCIIVVGAPLLVRLIRAKKRDNLPIITLLRRFLSQKQFNAQYSAKNADIYRVENSGFARSRLERRIDAILSKLGL